ncbi:PhzF family phenazine biosynthesis protein [Candidatus Finniella inopinata]|uniref:PhzF family phenazine biosynthesis isomerase n=1 Tax=Candidatus Finniella inopinata TaxID=1696036 RepID=A0A4V2DZT9_9PROT|nr:PhzF family phenazine biosynthesis isomerase [Candidatus Finniella inopinata]RZI46217.1 PhzF family phenazine biosynthesis isomerase [Candidatus Finniella inopinata]
MKIWLVDAFTAIAFQGNPAGICLVDHFPKTQLMQAIAAEMNWSQTAFVTQKADDHFHIRWFSPRDEAPLCGHATLAAAHTLWKEGRTDSQTLTFDSLGGILKAEKKSDGWIYLDFPLRPVTPCSLPDMLQEALQGITIQSVHRDETVYLVVLREAKDVIRLKPNLSIIEQIDCRAVIVTALGNAPYDFVSRYFAPRVGIPEDPVCGSAHCRLIPFWSEILNKNTLLAHQASPRSGVLKVSLVGDRVLIGGQAVTVSEGFLRI